MKTKEELKSIYEGLNESEKYGIQFAMLPAKLLQYNLSREDVSNLMSIRMELESNDVNKIKVK